MKVEMKGAKIKPSTVKELKAEIVRLEECLKAYETAEVNVLRVEWLSTDGHIFPRMILTAPGMDEEKIAKYAYKMYFLYAETLKSLMMDEKEEHDEET